MILSCQESDIIPPEDQFDLFAVVQITCRVEGFYRENEFICACVDCWFDFAYTPNMCVERMCHSQVYTQSITAFLTTKWTPNTVLKVGG